MEAPKNPKAKKQENLKSRFDSIQISMQPSVKNQLKTLKKNKDNNFKAKKNKNIDECQSTIDHITKNLYKNKKEISKEKNLNYVIPK